MRAGRLINILTTLQARGRVTAGELAQENGVSPRTIYRDIDHLTLAGVPVYSERGSDGGYRLLDGYRVKLNGLSSGEAEALFLAGLPGPAADLGLAEAMASAERKLTVALPEELRRSAARLRNRFHLDTLGWYTKPDHPRFLAAIADAVWTHKCVRMRYRSWKRENTVKTDPLGLVLKAGAWYMAARTDGAVRTYRISRVLDLTVTETIFDPPANFDLPCYWRETTEGLDAEMHPNTARIRLSEWGARVIPHMISAYARGHLEIAAEADPDGWREATLPVGSVSHAASDFLRLGAEVEVLEPADLRAQIAQIAAKAARIYAEPGTPGS